MSDSELYTILTNKAAKGKKGSIVAIVAGTKAETVIDVLQKIHINIRKKVREITLDMAANMELIAKRAFSNATIVTDRFHVQNWLQKPYRKSESNIVGKHWMLKMMPLN